MTADRSVRPAVPADAGFIADLQARGLVDSLEATLGASLPAELVARLRDDAVEQTWVQTLSGPRQADAVVLTAVAGAVPQGFALGVLAPVDGEHEQLRLPGVEVAALEVEPTAARQGHGSRLLAALSDSFRGRAEYICAWVSQADDVRIRFFQGAGLAPSGVLRKLAVGDQIVVQHLWWAAL